MIQQLILRVLLMIMILAGSFSSVQSQQTASFPALFSRQLEKWNQENPQERTAVQTDKGYYLEGETIWMKVWCVLDGAPSFLSRIVYVDLIDRDGKVIIKNMYSLDSNCSTAASIDIPYAILPGDYKVRAYTLWMLNYQAYAEKNIYIYSTESKSSTKTRPVRSIQFFPEGGDLIDGIASKVAFKIIDENGMPASARGIIKNKQGEQVAVLETKHDGMGIFNLAPNANQLYTCTIDNQWDYPLPDIKKEGVTISVTNTSSRIIVGAERSNLNAAHYNQLFLAATINGKIAFFNEFNFDEGKSAAAIQKKNLPPGILVLTLFSATGTPMAERVVFIENYDIRKPIIQQKPVQLSGDTILYQFSIDSMGSGANSLLVSDVSLNEQLFSEHIASSLLLTNEIKGYVHNPGYYFKDKSSETLQHLDLVLLTHGWRKYSWSDILGGKQQQLNYPVETNLSLKGKVTKAEGNTIIKDGKVNFIIKGDDSTHILSEATLTDKGEFIVDGLKFERKAVVFYQGTNRKRETYIVDVTFYPSYFDTLSKTAKRTELLSLDTVNLNSYTPMAYFLRNQLNSIDTAGNKYKNLSEIIVKGKKRLSKTDSLNVAYASPGIFQSGMTLDPSTQKSYQNIWMYLRAQVPGLTVEGGFINPRVSFNRYSNMQLPLQTADGESNDIAGGELVNGLLVNSGGIAFYLNESNVSQEVIEGLIIDDIALVKVLRIEAAALGAPGGAIAIYTKKGTDPYRKIFDKTFSKTEIKGFTPVKQFYYQPLEAKGSLIKSSTILWHGAFPGNQKQLSLRFLNKNKPAKIKIFVQGIDHEGNLSIAEKTVQL